MFLYIHCADIVVGTTILTPKVKDSDALVDSPMFHIQNQYQGLVKIILNRVIVIT